MSDKPIKQCDYCENTGVMPTFMDGETVCWDCIKRSKNRTRGEYLALLDKTEQQAAEIERLREDRDSQQRLCIDAMLEVDELKQERDQLKARSAAHDADVIEQTLLPLAADLRRAGDNGITVKGLIHEASSRANQLRAKAKDQK